MSYKFPFLIFFTAFSVFADFSNTDSVHLDTIKSLVSTINTRGGNLYTMLDYFTSENLTLLSGINGKLSDIDSYTYTLKSNSDLIYYRLQDVQFSLTNINNSIVNISNSITNSLVSDDGESVADILIDIRQLITNSVPMCFDLSFITNAFYTSLIYPDAVTMDDVLDLVDNYGMFAVNQSPFYWASIGFPRIRKSNLMYYELYDKIYSGLSQPVKNTLLYSLDVGPSIVDGWLDPWQDYWGVNLNDYMSASEVAKEKLFGTYDIEEILKSFTNQLSSSILNSYTHSSFNNQLSYATNLLRGSSSDFSTSVSSPTNATIYSTEDSSWSSAMSSSEFTPDDTQFVASFQAGFNQFVATWQNGIQVGSPTLVVHFAGVDGQLENTFSLDYTISNEARNKVRSIWHVIFILIRASLYFWGYMTLLRAVLNNYADTMRHNDFLEGADID